jgi:hypothetical protein
MWLQTSDTDIAQNVLNKIKYFNFFRNEKGAFIEVPRRRKRSFTCPHCHRNCFTTARLERHLRWASGGHFIRDPDNNNNNNNKNLYFLLFYRYSNTSMEYDI